MDSETERLLRRLAESASGLDAREIEAEFAAETIRKARAAGYIREGRMRERAETGVPPERPDRYDALTSLGASAVGLPEASKYDR